MRTEGATEGAAVLRQYVVKVHSRCNLGCDYCYLYTKADQRWRGRPVVMSESTVESLAARMAEHLAADPLPSVDVILHGGEPLLAGPARLRHLVERVRSVVGDLSDVHFSVQTNGSLLCPGVLDDFRELGVEVGVSLDGGPGAHDRHRRRPDGRGSHAAVSAGLRVLTAPAYRHLFRGLLCTVDLENDPIETYDALLQFVPPAVDFLLPHANWQHPPPVPPGRGAAPYGDWLVEVFERWYGTREQGTRVRLFESVIDRLLGRPSGVEGIGPGVAEMVVVETDGLMERTDVLASAFHGAAVTGLSVATDTFRAFLALPDVTRPPAGSDVPTPCRPCRVHSVCGGGLPAHRYTGGGFDHRSVYCRDLLRLIEHVRSRVLRDLAALRSVS